jgi:putative transposase
VAAEERAVSRRGCGKCGKAEASCARLFQARVGIRVVCGFPYVRHFPQPFAAAVLSLAAEDPDIRNAKNLPTIRDHIQTSRGRTDRKRSFEPDTGGTRLSDCPKLDRAMAGAVPEQWIGQLSNPTGTAVGRRERKAEGEDRGSDHGDGPHKKMASLGSAAEKRGYIRDHRKELGSISKACQIGGLASSSYYYKPDLQRRHQRDSEDERLRRKIEAIQEQFPGYGYRRLEQELDRCGMKVNAKRIRRVMLQYDLQPITWRRFIRTTNSSHTQPVYPNLLRNRRVCGLNQVWVADLTYIGIRDGFVYLAAILDLYSRKVVGWAISKRIDTELCITALEMALAKRHPRGCIHHSDRGVQYASTDYVARLRQNGLQISMSAKGNPYDNAFMESFYKTLKYEEVYLWNYESYADVIDRLPFFIEEVYNRRRLHSSIGYVPPAEFEANLHNKKPADRPVLIL